MRGEMWTWFLEATQLLASQLLAVPHAGCECLEVIAWMFPHEIIEIWPHTMLHSLFTAASLLVIMLIYATPLSIMATPFLLPYWHIL